MISIRQVNNNDVKRILEIYTPYVLNTIVTFEIEVPTLEDMENRMKNTLKKFPYLVAEYEGKVVGYAYASTFKGRQAYDQSCELSIYVDENYQRLHIATKLYDRLFLLLKNMGIHGLYACLGYPNDKSELFHQKLGFKTIGKFSECGYKFNKWCDMIWMEKHMNQEKRIFIPYVDLPRDIIEECLK